MRARSITSSPLSSHPSGLLAKAANRPFLALVFVLSAVYAVRFTLVRTGVWYHAWLDAGEEYRRQTKLDRLCRNSLHRPHLSANTLGRRSYSVEYEDDDGGGQDSGGKGAGDEEIHDLIPEQCRAARVHVGTYPALTAMDAVWRVTHSCLDVPCEDVANWFGRQALSVLNSWASMAVLVFVAFMAFWYVFGAMMFAGRSHSRGGVGADKRLRSPPPARVRYLNDGDDDHHSAYTTVRIESLPDADDASGVISSGARARQLDYRLASAPYTPPMLFGEQQQQQRARPTSRQHAAELWAN